MKKLNRTIIKSEDNKIYTIINIIECDFIIGPKLSLLTNPSNLGTQPCYEDLFIEDFWEYVDDPLKS